MSREKITDSRFVEVLQNHEVRNGKALGSEDGSLVGLVDGEAQGLRAGKDRPAFIFEGDDGVEIDEFMVKRSGVVAASKGHHIAVLVSRPEGDLPKV